jgi:hypothetical protein
VDAVRRALRFEYAVLLRALVAIGGATTAYGATGMFSTAGFMPPTVVAPIVVLVALVLLVRDVRALAKR